MYRTPDELKTARTRLKLAREQAFCDVAYVEHDVQTQHQADCRCINQQHRYHKRRVKPTYGWTFTDSEPEFKLRELAYKDARRDLHDPSYE